MSKVYYKSSQRLKKRQFIRLFSFLLFTFGLFVVLYIFFPLISYQVYFSKAIASQTFTAPIPKVSLISSASFTDLVSSAAKSVHVDYSDARNWYPTFNQNRTVKTTEYFLSIPKLNVKDAIVSTVDQNLDNHLVHFNPTNLPPENGNTVIFGHSTLPQLFDPKNYKTIFSYAYRLSPSDDIFVTVNSITYHYKVQNSVVVDPEDTSILTQTYDTSYLTIVTCTPPGTVWKRLAIKAKLEKI